MVHLRAVCRRIGPLELGRSPSRHELRPSGDLSLMVDSHVIHDLNQPGLRIPSGIDLRDGHQEGILHDVAGILLA